MQFILHSISKSIEVLGRLLVSAFATVGGMTMFSFSILKAFFPPSFDYEETLEQLDRVGVRSLPVVLATALFVGAIMVIQGGDYVRATGATSLIGWAAGTGVLAEIGPVLIGLMFSGRVGANITAELGTMVVTEQILALRTLGIDPIRYLVVPRFVSMVVILLILTCIGDLFALLGGAITCQIILGIDMRVYWQSVIESHLLDEFFMGLVKGVAFGAVISITACYKGLSVTGGAEGVGRGVNDGVVITAIGIFMVNTLVTVIWL